VTLKKLRASAASECVKRRPPRETREPVAVK
jgi:hypothetical protein